MLKIFTDLYFYFSNMFYDIVNGWIEAGVIQKAYLATWLVMFVVYRFFLCLSVYADCKEKAVNHKIIIPVLTFFFGAVVSIIYAIATRKNHKTDYIKTKNLFVILTIAAVIISFNAHFAYDLSLTGEFSHLLNPDFN